MLDPDTVVIVATADIQAKSIEKDMGLGAFHVLNKPPAKVSVREIFLKVDEHRGREHGN